MDQKSKQLESIFKAACEQQAITPSSRVLRKLKTRLWLSDFVSVNPKKVNILYTALLLGGITTTAVIMRTNESKIKDESAQQPVLVDIKNSDSKSIPATPEVSSDNNNSETVNESSGNALFMKAEFSMNLTRGCSPLSVGFKNQSPADCISTWDFGTGDKSSERNPEYTFTEAGNYKVTLTVKSKDGMVKAITQNVEVLEKPVARFEVDIENSEIQNRKLVLKNLSKGGTEYLWDFGDNNQTEGNKVTHSYSDFGIYTITLVSEAANGCTDTARITSNFLEKNYELSFPLNFRPNPVERNDGYYEKAGTETSIFYPKNFGAKEYDLTIYAPNGIKVFSSNTIKQGWNGYIGVRLAPTGKYSWETSGIYPNGKSFRLKGTVMVKSQEYD